MLMGKYKVLTGEFADLMLGYYGATIGEKDPEVLKLAEATAKKPAITCRPADLLKPGMGKPERDGQGAGGQQWSGRRCVDLRHVPPGCAQVFQDRAARAAKTWAKIPRLPKRPSRRLRRLRRPVKSRRSTAEVNYVITLNGREHRVSVAPEK